MTTPPAGPQEAKDDDEPRTEAGRRVIADWGAQFLNGLDLHTITDRIVAIEEEAAVRGGAPAALREAAIRGAADDVRARHAPNEWDSCVACRATWPCDAELLAELVITGQRLSENTVESLDDAWKAAEAALPDGWRLKVSGPHPVGLHTAGSDRGHPFYAEASQPFAQSFVPAGQQDGFRIESGATPEAALRALARSLSSRLDASEEET